MAVQVYTVHRGKVSIPVPRVYNCSQRFDRKAPGQVKSKCIKYTHHLLFVKQVTDQGQNENKMTFRDPYGSLVHNGMAAEQKVLKLC